MTIDFIECGDFRRTIGGWLSTSFEPFAVSTRVVVAAAPHKVPRAKSVWLFFQGKSSLKEGEKGDSTRFVTRHFHGGRTHTQRNNRSFQNAVL